MIKLILADDHKIFRESLKQLLTLDGFAEVIDEAANGIELLAKLEKQIPDLIILDLLMPHMNGLEVTSKALEKWHDLKILILSSTCNENAYLQLIEAGVRGYVDKTAGIEELRKAIRAVNNGESWFSEDILRSLLVKQRNPAPSTKKPPLTNREVEIVHLICQGLTNQEIATKLNLSIETIKWHRTNILDKTKMKNVASLVIYAIKNKIIQL